MAKPGSGIRDFLTSVRLSIVLLAAIALGAVVGTIIPQQEAAEAFAEKLNPSLAALFQALQLFDVYHSVWFIGLLGLLAVNLIACSLDRFPAAWRQFRGVTGPIDPGLFAALPPERIVETDRPPDEAAVRIEALLARRWRRLVKTEHPQGLLIAAEKGGFSRFGVYVVHFGVLAMIAGGMAGGLMGVKGSIEIVEGESSNVLQRRGEPSLPLEFSIRCDRFTVEYYASGAPKVFRSDLSFLKGGQVVHQGPLLVNHPIDFGGLRFYQSSYGILPGGRMTLSYAKGREEKVQREITVGERFELPGAGGEVEVLRAEGNLMRMGPAVKLAVRSSRGDFQFWVFQNIERIKEANPGILSQVPLMNPGLFAPWIFSLQRGGERFYTVLQATRDPGAPLVAAGAILLIAGLITVFFFSHRRVRILLKAREEGSRICVAGTASRDPIGLEGELRRLAAAIRGEGKVS
ncbi:MAG: cytochrome c biogenesis protein ResB [Deltaproteobacteria bacterium]|nr:cytochrome c biogenesis protein ResB [Deltaproteobacteria bacterium]